MSYSIFKYLKTVRNVYENEAKLSIFQADFIDRGAINLARAGTRKDTCSDSATLSAEQELTFHILMPFFFFFKQLKTTPTPTWKQKHDLVVLKAGSESVESKVSKVEIASTF